MQLLRGVSNTVPGGTAGLQVLALASAQQHLVNLQLGFPCSSSLHAQALEQQSPGAGGVPKARHWHPTRRAGGSQSPGVRRLGPSQADSKGAHPKNHSR